MHPLFTLLLFLSLLPSLALGDTLLELSGSLGTSGGEFADYSALSSGDSFGPSSDNDASLTISLGTDGAPRWSSTGYPGSGSEINFQQGVADTLTPALAFSNQQYLNLDLTATSAIDLTTLSVQLWRNGSGAPNTFQFAYDADANGWDTGDLLGAPTVVPTTGTDGAATISLNSGLPTILNTATLRLYFWDTDGNAGASGNTHLFKLSLQYTATGPTPPGIITQPQNQTVSEGSDVTFTVLAAGDAPLSYLWRKDTGSGPVDLPSATTDTLILNSVSQADAADYSVVVTNNEGSVTSNDATLTIQAVIQNPGPQDKPNILLIIADDMGFSDIGAYGSEIQTPRLDSLAAQGIRFTNFYNHAKCSPTRGAIQSSTYVQNPTGINIGSSLTSGLVDAGYAAFGIGKNHGSFGSGTYRMRTSMDGGAENHFNPGLQRDGESEIPARKPGTGTTPANNWTIDNVSVNVKNGSYTFPEDWYSTISFTDIGIRYLSNHLATDEPFFMVMAYTAPHWPLHALPEDKALFEGAYDEGWDVVRNQRYQRLMKLGFFGDRIPLSPAIPGQIDWEALSISQKEDFADRMETHAAMVYRLDLEIGRLLDHLDAMGRLDNTLIVFLSDNGADSSDYSKTTDSSAILPDTTSQTSYVGFGRDWANAANSPYRLHKQTIFEGGARAPVIMVWPGMLPEARSGEWNDTLAHVVDLLPTFFDAAGVTVPANIEGKSLKPVFETGTRSGTDAHSGLGFQYGTYIGYRQGDFKLISHEGRNWELYDLSIDPAETHNLAGDPNYATTIADLEAAFDDWATYGGTTTRDFFVGSYDGGADQGAHPVPGGGGFVSLSGTNITYTAASDVDSANSNLEYRSYWSYRGDLSNVGELLAWAHPINSNWSANTTSLGGLSNQSEIARGATVYCYVLVQDENTNRAAYTTPASYTFPTRNGVPIPGQITAVTVQEPATVSINWTLGSDSEDTSLGYALLVGDQPLNSVEKALTYGRFVTGYRRDATSATVNRLPGGDHYFAVLVRDSDRNIVLSTLQTGLPDASATLTIGAVSTYADYVAALGNPANLLDPNGDANSNGLSNFYDFSLGRDPRAAASSSSDIQILSTAPLTLGFPGDRDLRDVRYRVVVNSSLDFTNDRTILFDSDKHVWQYEGATGEAIAEETVSYPLRFGRLEIDKK